TADLNNINTPSLQHGHARGRLGDLEEDQALEMRHSAPVLRHRLKDDAVTAYVLHELPRSCAHRMPLCLLFPDALKIFLGMDEASAGEQPLAHPVIKSHKRLLKAQSNGIRILDLHTFNEAHLWRQPIGRALLHNGREGKLDVFCGQFTLTIVKGDSFA